MRETVDFFAQYVENKETYGLVPLYAMGPVSDYIPDSGYAVSYVFNALFVDGYYAGPNWIYQDSRPHI